MGRTNVKEGLGEGSDQVGGQGIWALGSILSPTSAVRMLATPLSCWILVCKEERLVCGIPWVFSSLPKLLRLWFTDRSPKSSTPLVIRIPGDKTGRVEGSMQLQQRDLGYYKITTSKKTRPWSKEVP